MISGLISITMQAIVYGAELDLQSTADEVTNSRVSKPEGTTTVTYDILSRGNVNGNVEEFRRIVAETLADKRGWVRAGVKFVEVESGGSMHVTLAEPAVIGAISGCSALLSCRVGAYVYINDDKWMDASDSYNALGISLLSYRRMVVNHEVGHFLGHGHIAACETEAGLAPIMLQQSTGLRGCMYNLWPLPGELWHKL